MRKLIMSLCLLGILSIFVFASPLTLDAQIITPKIPVERGPLYQINKHFSTQTTTYNDGTVLERSIISPE
jgi:hypothetical protein